MEPRLVVFTDDGALSQMVICAENRTVVEVPGEQLVDGIVFLMASYYALNVAYPKPYRSLLFFFQDILMQKPDTGNRPIRYKAFISRISF